MSHINSRATESYKDALRATESIDPPSLGFLKTSDYLGTLSHQAAVIKQHNTQIQLLTRIAEDLKDIKTELQALRELQQARSTPTQAIPEDLITKLENLNLGTSERPKESKGRILVFKNPLKILAETRQ